MEDPEDDEPSVPLSRAERHLGDACALAIIATLGYLWARTPPPANALNEVYSTAIGVQGILLGFLTTAKAVVLTAPDRPIVEKLRVDGYLSSLFNLMGRAIWRQLLAVVVGCVALYLNLTTEDGWRVLTAVVWSGLSTTAFVVFIQATNATSTAFRIILKAR